MVGQSLTLNGRVINPNLPQGVVPSVSWVHTYTTSNGVKQSINVFTTRNGCRFTEAMYGGVVDTCDDTNHIYNIRFPSVTTRHAGSWHIESPHDTPVASEKITVVVLGEFHSASKSHEVNDVQVSQNGGADSA